MAEYGPVGSHRSFLFILIASVLTLGLYWIYWFYKTNAEIKEYGNMGHSPGMRLAMLLFGWILLIVPTLYAYYAWLRDVNSLAQKVGVDGVSPIGNMILLFIPLGNLYTTYKVQAVLNNIWEKGAKGPVKSEGQATPAAAVPASEKVVVVCPKCKTRNAEEHNYCKKCGEKISG